MKDNKQDKKDDNDKRKCSRDIQQHFFCCVESNTTSITRLTIYRLIKQQHNYLGCSIDDYQDIDLLK